MHATQASPAKRYTRFCGIDVAKQSHVACILNRHGEFVVRSQAFANDADGYQRLLDRLREAGGSRRVLVAMEATGHYWYALHDHLIDRGYAVVVLNPIQTKQQARKDIRKRKTDRTDARHVAMLVKNGEHKPALVPGPLAMTCRQLTRQRDALVRQTTRIKQLFWARLTPVWPEYEPLFADPFCKTSRMLLDAAPTPVDLLDLEEPALRDLIRRASRGQCGPAHAEAIRKAAATSVGTRRGLDGARIGIRLLLAQLEALAPIRERLEAEITTLADRLPRHIFTLPGASPIHAASLFGETDPITAFAEPSQLVAFAGLDLTVFQTGQYSATRRRLTKRGSPHLRRTLWHMAHHACFRDGELGDHYQRLRRQGLHHFAAVTAVALKLTRAAWRILTDRRDYQPRRPES